MWSLARTSVRHRTAAFTASFVSLFLGATILMSFASLLDAAGSAQATSTDKEALTLMAGVVGGWGLIIVVFAVASTLTLSVRQRSTEMALLKSIGATPRQVRRMITAEAAIVALAAVVAAIPFAVVGGRVVFDLLQGSDQITAGVHHRFGPIALIIGLGVTLVGATIAAGLTARRATKVTASEAMRAAAVGTTRMSKKRKVAAVVFMAFGVETAVLTATMFNGKGSEAMQTGGQASIWFAIGLALLAPALARAGVKVLAGPLPRLGGVGGYLTVHNLRQRSQEMAGALMPIILFTAIATGTIYMQVIENGAPAVAGMTTTVEDKNIETLNFVVVGMIAVFAAIMLINSLIASTTYRRREFAQQRLVGATPPQVLRTVSLESVVLVVTGVFFGSVASLFTVIPYSIARTDSVLPDTTIAIYLGIVAIAAVLTMAATLGSAQHAIKAPAIQAVAA